MGPVMMWNCYVGSTSTAQAERGPQSLRSYGPSRPHSSGVQPQKETNTLEGIVLPVGQQARLDIPLAVGSVAQTVQV
jgi:hypothetical protein